MNTNPDNIKSRIQKLLALANDKGASEDEAATAMRMAMGLMAKHGIQQSELSTQAQQHAKLGEHLKGKFRQYQVTVASAAATLYGCRVIYRTFQREIVSLQFAGRQDNIEAAEVTTMWLTQQVESLYKTALPKGLTKTQRAEYRRTFKDACANRVSARAQQLVKELATNTAAALSATGKNALVVQGYFDQCFKEADDELAKMNVKSVSRKFSYGAGTLDGMSAGDRVQLRQSVDATTQTNNGRLT